MGIAWSTHDPAVVVIVVVVAADLIGIAVAALVAVYEYVALLQGVMGDSDPLLHHAHIPHSFA